MQIDINDTELLVEEDKEDNKLTSNVFWAGFNLINAILGTGMIGKDVYLALLIGKSQPYILPFNR